MITFKQFKESQDTSVHPENEDVTLYHGGHPWPKGARTFDPKRIGSGEGHQVNGPGLYATPSKDLASNYVQFGGPNAELHELKLHKDAGVIFVGHVFNEVSPILQEKHRKLSQRAQEVFKSEGLLRKNIFTDKDEHWLDAASRTSIKDQYRNEKVRHALIKAGVDATVQRIPAGLEYVVHNPEKLTKVGVSDEDHQHYLQHKDDVDHSYKLSTNDEIARHGNVVDQWKLAESPEVAHLKPISFLKLLNHEDSFVRMALAGNEHAVSRLSDHHIASYLRDEDSSVRTAMAFNHAAGKRFTPAHIDMILNHPDKDVQSMAIHNTELYKRLTPEQKSKIGSK